MPSMPLPKPAPPKSVLKQPVGTAGVVGAGGGVARVGEGVVGGVGTSNGVPLQAGVTNQVVSPSQANSATSATQVGLLSNNSTTAASPTIPTKASASTTMMPPTTSQTGSTSKNDPLPTSNQSSSSKTASLGANPSQPSQPSQAAQPAQANSTQTKPLSASQPAQPNEMTKVQGGLKTYAKPMPAPTEEIEILPQPGTAVVRPIPALEELRNPTQPQPALARGSTAAGGTTNAGTGSATGLAAGSALAAGVDQKILPTNSANASSSPSIPPQVPPTFPGGTPPPATPPVPQPTPSTQQPPRTLSALQSMSSNTLPGLPQDNLPSTSQPSNQPPSAGANKTSNVVKSDGKSTAGGGANDTTPEVAQPKKSILRFLPIALGVILILAAIGFAAYWFLGQRGDGGSGSSNTGGQTTPVPTAAAEPVKSVDLEYWGLWEPSEAMAAVIKDYQDNNPGVTITYKKQSHKDYRERLQNAIVSGNGPDIFRYHASWVPMLEQELAPLPSAVMTSSEFSSTFYPVAAEQLNIDGQIVGIPLMYEGLALYYNTEIFSTAVEEPPATWPELRTIAKKLTVRTANGKVRAGAALGNATNVEHFADIIAVLMLQNGADLTKPNSIETRDALLFYTNFMKVDQVWDASLPSSTVAFAQGDVAMMLAPSWRAHEIRAANPNLPFAVVPLPQLSDERIAWATYWAEGVSEQSENTVEAWQFVKYMSSADVQKQLHSEQSQARAFGELYSRKDLANELAGDPIMSAYLQDAPFAKGWHMSTYTHDDGINDNIIKYYENAVTALVSGSGIDEVLETLDQGVRQELRQYGVAETAQ